MRKITNKAVSVILVVALCVSTLCGALIPASAAIAGNTYVIKSGAVAAGSKTITYEVTLTSPSGITSGTFDLMLGKDVIDDVNFDDNGDYIVPKNETIEDFHARDVDKNSMINGTNVYKTVEVYDEEGNKTEKQVVDYVTKENEGNKGVALPNVFDGKIGLYDTKIEITGGTRDSDNGFSLSDFSNDSFAGMTVVDDKKTQKIEGSQTIDGVNYRYVYNMTDNYKETHSNPVTYEEVIDAEGNTKSYPVQDNNLLDKYYREYTTVDVATENLSYSISTVSEDSVRSMEVYSQYAQGFKDITFTSSKKYSSITFTVTLDFTGNCDRSNANSGVDKDKLTAVINGKNCTNTDGRWADENYVQYDGKYELNFLSEDTALSTFTASETGGVDNYAHVHQGTIDEKTGRADPSNKAAIEALLAKNPNAKEGIDYFELYDAKCTVCGQITPMIAAPDLPYKVTSTDADGNNVLVNANGTKGRFGFNNYRNISGISLNYNNDGTVALNIHYPTDSNMMNGEQMIITDENGMVLKYSDTIEKADDNTSIHTSVPSNYASKKVVIDDKEVSRYEGYLRNETRMITIDNLSAKEADQTLYIARYTPSSSTETQLMGITHAISIADYCSQVIKGDKVYYLKDDNYSETKKEEDKLVAASFMNYAHASKNALAVTENRTVDLLEFGKNGENLPGSTSPWYDTGLADNGESGDSWEDAIIIDSAEEFVYLAKASGNDTKGKYYKVADNIAGFNLATDKLDLNGTLEENLDIVKGCNKDHGGAQPGFQGNFDGNGATVYGAWTNHNKGSINKYSGLFSCTKGDVTIKNINVKFASFTATNAVGGIVGYHEQTKTQDEANAESSEIGTPVTPITGSLTIENCSVIDCHLEVTTNGYGRGLGAIVGYTNNCAKIGGVWVNGPVIIKNCFVKLDEEYFISLNEIGKQTDTSLQGIHGGLAAFVFTSALKVSDCIVIGINPYASTTSSDNAIQHSGKAEKYTNIYTDVTIGTNQQVGGTTSAQDFTPVMTQLETEKLTGLDAAANMPNLDWDTTWCATEGYPTLYKPYNAPDVKKTIYWDGKVAESIAEGSGTKNDPYIINTASELAYIVKDKAVKGTETISVNADGTPKYFKVSDDIENIVLQQQDFADAIINLKDAAAVKEYFESNDSSMKKWPNYDWEKTAFAGVFDGNGATVYGLYQVSNNNAGLFSTIDAGAVIKNIALKNSYLTSTATNYQVGGIAAITANPTKEGEPNAMANNGAVWFDRCTVANNYMHNAATDNSGDRSGIIIGAATDLVYIDNCLVYGNDATFTEGKMSILSVANNNVLVNSDIIVPEGLTLVDDGAETPRYNNMIRNTVILGALPYDLTQIHGGRFNDAKSFENVYTDQPAGAVTFPGTPADNYNPVLKFTTAQIKHIDVADIYGSGAKTVMPNLDWYDVMSNSDGVWYNDYLSAMPSLKPISNSFSTAYPDYDNVTFTEADADINQNSILHENGTMKFGVYTTALSLYSNPYLSFVFAFHGDYKTTRDKIKIKFVYTENGQEHVTAEITPPACEYDEDGNIKDLVWVNNWANVKASGRYHTYKATGIPVEALAYGITVMMSHPDVANGEYVDYGTYSAKGIGYAFDQLNTEESPSEYYAACAEATRALVFYADAIKARYGTL